MRWGLIMPPLIVYHSLTDNTRLLAEKLQAAYPGASLFTAQQVQGQISRLQQAPIVFVGFWCDRGMMPESIQALVPHLKDKKLGVFATMGGDPQSDRAKQWFARQCDALVGEDRGNLLLAHFLCQGKIDPALIERMKKLPGYKETPESVARRELAATHPNESDLSELVRVFREGFGG